jgi:formylmethanofuran dehydrogenase subunit B
MMVNERLVVVTDAICTGCGCLCDDLTIRVQGRQIVAADGACPLGETWLKRSRPDDRPGCTIAGRPASLEAGFERAAEILRAARYPLVYGLVGTTTEAQRVAVAIADAIGGSIDTPTSQQPGPSGMAFHGVGEMTCTLGEIRNRGDLVIFWGTNPAHSHPRHFNNYSLWPPGMFLPQGRSDRTCVVVDVSRTETAEQADIFLQIAPGKDFEALSTLRMLAQGLSPDAATIESETGVPLSAWQDLIERMKRARFGVLLYGGGLTTTHGKHLNVDAALALTRDMNAFTRFVANPMHGPAARREDAGTVAAVNTMGAENVLLWQTGFPFSVNLSHGYPRYSPGEYSAVELLARHEADAALLVGSAALGQANPRARERLATIPYVTLDPEETPLSRGAAVAFSTAACGIHTGGTMYRMDDVPLPLQAALESPYPSDETVLRGIQKVLDQR